jgi:tRNA-splicing ligase RtcB
MEESGSFVKDIRVFGREIIETKCITQLEGCIGEGDIGVLTPDAHYGYAHPIGGAVAYKNRISVSGVGFDIACGNKAVQTSMRLEDIKEIGGVNKIMNEIVRRISFGMGRHNNEKIGHAVLDKIAHADFKPQRELHRLACDQLGTVGGGNHFVDLFVDNNGYIWIGVHFGSRGFGHKTATGFIAMSKGLSFDGRASEGSMDSAPIIFDTNSSIGQEYISAMSLAGEYAYAGRDIVVDRVLEILGNPKVTFEVHNHHNFAWEEVHNNEKYWVVRKGCTPAFAGQYSFIGANMIDSSVIVVGKDTKESKDALFSTVHGAGRIMSRTQAAGKKKWVRGEDGRKRPIVIGEGKVNFAEVKKQMKERKVILKGAGADEAPECYKKLTDVLSHMSNNVDIVHNLHPIGVAMAGDEYDEYKD